MANIRYALLFTTLLALSVLAAITTEALVEQDFHTFVTRPDILAPKWNITTYHPSLLQQSPPGSDQGQYHWFTAPYAAYHQTTFEHWTGPLIYDTSGELVWSGAPLVNYSNTYDFRVSTVEGRSMLSFIVINNQSEGREAMILDDQYRLHATMDLRGGRDKANMHEFRLLDDGRSALIVAAPGDADADVMVDLPHLTEARRVHHEGFREIDIRTGEVKFEFSTLDNLQAAEHTHVKPKIAQSEELLADGSWDVFHINSLDRFPNGDYLFSARYTDAIYRVSHQNASILWRLGGLDSSFETQPQTFNFSRQHHARIHASNETHTAISLFNNVGGPGYQRNIGLARSFPNTSQGLLISLNTATTPTTAEIVMRFPQPPEEGIGAFIRSRGSLELLPNGNMFVGWSQRGYFSEHAPDGSVLMKAVFGSGFEGDTYRAYKLPWLGRPVQPPDVVALAAVDESGEAGKGDTRVWVSWNGATEAASWRLLETNARGYETADVAEEVRTGFETLLTVSYVLEYIIVLALDGEGNELGRSSVVAVQTQDYISHDALPAALEEAETAFSNAPAWSTLAEAQAALAPNRSGWFTLGFMCALALALCACCMRARTRRVLVSSLTAFWDTSAVGRSKYTAIAKAKEGEEEEDGMRLQVRAEGSFDEDPAKRVGRISQGLRGKEG